MKQLMDALPSRLPGMERSPARQSDPSGVTGIYKRTGEAGPARVDVRIMHGTIGLRQARNFSNRPDVDSTARTDGRTLHSGVIETGSPRQSYSGSLIPTWSEWKQKALRTPR